MSIDDTINALLGPVAQTFFNLVFHTVPIGSASVPLVVVWLSIASVALTVYFGFISIRGFRHAVRVTRGDFADPEHRGDVSHFRALTTALSGTLGVGNVSGVALAVTMGGPGAAFWMCLAGFLGMSVKFAECALSVKYRQYRPDGTVAGGPMYYIEAALAQRRLPKIGKALAIFFAAMMVLGSFNPFQVNQAFVQFSLVTGFENGFAFGLCLAIVLALIIFGGMRRIASVTVRLVPTMCAVYLIAALVVLFVHAADLPRVLALIVTQAFTGDAVVGGALGSLIVGFQRAAFSSEAGLGSAAVAHAAVKTGEPMTEGYVALLEPFIDTVVICTLTALVVVATGANGQGIVGGVEITSVAFASVMPWFPPVLSVVVFLLAFSTVLAWAYYGERAWGYLFGESGRSTTVYKVLLLAGISVGATLTPLEAVRFMDAAVFAMAVPNILALYLLAPELKRELQAYRQRLASGAIVNQRLLARAAVADQ